MTNRATDPGAPATRLSVCIVTFNSDQALLERCVSSVHMAALEAEVTYEVVIVDNGSRDVSVRLEPDPCVRVLGLAHNLGFGAAANVATRRARGEVVLYLNPDAALLPRSLAALLDLAGGPQGATTLFCGWLTSDLGVQVDAYRLWRFSTERLLTRRRWLRQLHAAEAAAESVTPVDKVCGGALFGRTTLLLELGPFDEEFFLYGEDADLSMRAVARGIALRASPLVPVRHERASSMIHYPVLVERARTDAALRLAARYSRPTVSLAVRLELLVITLGGAVLGGRSSASRRTRLVRLKELQRWGLTSQIAPFHPPLL